MAAKETGRPGYDPADLLKLYVYGYINRVRSSRRLEAETHRNIEVIWLLRHLKPDFRTIADFRRVKRSALQTGVPGVCHIVPRIKGSPVRYGSRRSMPAAVHAYLFYLSRRQNSPAYKVVVNALKI